MRIIVFDTEATDLTPGQICQLSYLIIENGAVAGRNFFFEVDEMSEGAQQVHGMGLDALRALSGGQRFSDWADEVFLDFRECGLLVGHNVAFDERYLRVEFDRLGMKLPKLKTFCTMNYFTGVMNMKRKVAVGRPKPPKLEELIAHYGLAPEFVAERAVAWFGDGAAVHDARYDAAATYLCLKAAAERGDLRGVV